MILENERVIVHGIYKGVVIGVHELENRYDVMTKLGTYHRISGEFVERDTTLRSHIQPLDDAEVESNTLIPVDQFVDFTDLKIRDTI